MTDKETTFDDYLKEQLKDPEFRKEWEKLRDEDTVMNNDLISRSELKKTIINICGNCSNIIREYKEGVPDGNCAIQHIMNMIDNAPTVDLWQLRQEATENALKKAEVYREDVKQALNGWLNNTTSPNTALNEIYEIYRAYMGRDRKPENSHIEYIPVNGVPGLYKQEIVPEPDKQITIEEYMQSLKGEN